jgi:hypothetical protein
MATSAEIITVEANSTTEQQETASNRSGKTTNKKSFFMNVLLPTFKLAWKQALRHANKNRCHYCLGIF